MPTTAWPINCSLKVSEMTGRRYQLDDIMQVPDAATEAPPPTPVDQLHLSDLQADDLLTSKTSDDDAEQCAAAADFHSYRSAVGGSTATDALKLNKPTDSSTTRKVSRMIIASGELRAQNTTAFFSITYTTYAV